MNYCGNKTGQASLMNRQRKMRLCQGHELAGVTSIPSAAAAGTRVGQHAGSGRRAFSASAACSVHMKNGGYERNTSWPCSRPTVLSASRGFCLCLRQLCCKYEARPIQREAPCPLLRVAPRFFSPHTLLHDRTLLSSPHISTHVRSIRLRPRGCDYRVDRPASSLACLIGH